MKEYGPIVSVAAESTWPTRQLQGGTITDSHAISRLSIYSFEDGTTIPIHEMPDERTIQHLQFSPHSNFLCIYTKVQTNQHKYANEDNCFIWSRGDKKIIYSFLNRNTNNWLVHWTSDESFFVRFSGHPGELVITNICAPSTPCFFFRDKNAVSFSLSPSTSFPKIAIYFGGENESSPSNIRIFSFPGGLSAAPKAIKSFYRADGVDLLWNHTGSHLIAFIHSNEDRNGKSYYGHESIIFMSADRGLDCQLRLGRHSIASI